MRVPAVQIRWCCQQVYRRTSMCSSGKPFLADARSGCQLEENERRVSANWLHMLRDGLQMVTEQYYVHMTIVCDDRLPTGAVACTPTASSSAELRRPRAAYLYRLKNRWPPLTKSSTRYSLAAVCTHKQRLLSVHANQDRVVCIRGWHLTPLQPTEIVNSPRL